MKSKLPTLIVIATLIVVTFFPAESPAQERQLSKEDQSRFSQLTDVVLSGQLRDGAIPVVRYPNPGQPAFVDPYFANLTALGVLSVYGSDPPPQVLKLVKDWLDWCVKHQEPDGTFKRFDGQVDAGQCLSNNAKRLPPDSLDSYAATLLATSFAWASVAKEKPSPELTDACRKCFAVLERCRDEKNGFYWNFDKQNVPNGVVPAQYCLDCVEVHQGLVSAAEIFNLVGDDKLARLAESRAQELANRMNDFWQPTDEFFVTMFADKTYGVKWGDQVATAERLATVSALAFFENLSDKTRGDLWTKFWSLHGLKVLKTFSGDQFASEDPTVERIYFAAVKSDANQKDDLRDAVRRRADELIKRRGQIGSQPGLPQPGVHRFAMLAQALLVSDSKLTPGLPSVPLDAAKAP